MKICQPVTVKQCSKCGGEAALAYSERTLSIRWYCLDCGSKSKIVADSETAARATLTVEEIGTDKWGCKRYRAI
jgi:ribosomal protein S27AE